ncbi:MAG: hypothetical protein WAL91_00960 [Propionicimonas sp.]
MLKRSRRWVGQVLGRSRPKADPAELRVRFSTQEQFAAFISDPRAGRKYLALDLAVDPWFPIRPDWTGRLGPLPGVVSVTADFEPEATRARVSVRTAEPVAGFDLVRAAFELFYPTRPSTGWGGERVGIAAGAPVDLCWRPGGGLRPRYRKPPKNRFTDFEIRIDAEGERLLRDHPAPPVLVERPPAPPVLIDPKVHRPLERWQPGETTRSAQARVEGERLLVEGPGGTLLDVPAEAPLTATDLRRLAQVTAIEVSGVGSGRQASRRVAELAAYGAIVHDARPGLDLDPALAGLVCSPFAPVGLLDHMNRSLAQVRAVMRGHTRAFTQHALPTISVILSCQRPNLLERVLEQLAASDHPHLEVVVGCHGFPAPARESFPEHLQAVLGPILEFGPEVIFGDVLARLSAAASGDFLSKVDDDDFYGPSHLSDLLTAWTYSEAQLVGKKLALVHFERTDTTVVRKFFLEGYRWDVAGGASLIGRHDLAAIGGWRSQRRAVDRGLQTRLEDAGGLRYACSGPGYVHTRHAEGHTWSVSDRYFLETFAEETLPGIPPAALGLFA